MAEERQTGSSTQPFVPAETTMREFSIRALLLGLVMCVILGAANAYLGLKAGMTIAATYPAAVIGMAVLKIMKGSLLEENFARTVGAIGESIAAGAVFTIPAFYIAGIWKQFDSTHYLEATSIMFVGSVVGILFVTVLRRVMVEDPEFLSRNLSRHLKFIRQEGPAERARSISSVPWDLEPRSRHLDSSTFLPRRGKDS